MSEAQNGGNVMERLTYWNEEYGCWSYHCGSGEAANRLAAYEDTKLTPKETKRIANILMDVGIDYNCSWEYVKNWLLDGRLRELAEADRDGRVVVLPCKVGGEVYSTLDDLGRLHQCRATYVLLNEKPYLNTVALEPVDYEGSQYGASFGAFGQTVFLTREEAEKALEAMKDE